MAKNDHDHDDRDFSDHNFDDIKGNRRSKVRLGECEKQEGNHQHLNYPLKTDLGKISNLDFYNKALDSATREQQHAKRAE